MSQPVRISFLARRRTTSDEETHNGSTLWGNGDLLLISIAIANCDEAWFPCLDRTLVKKIQDILTQKGFYHGKLDGVYSNNTQLALARFARSKNISFNTHPKVPMGDDDNRYLTAGMSEALFGVRFDYVNADVEERLEFLKKIGIVNK